MEKFLNIEIEISGRHAHLSAEAVAKLFGEDFRLTKLKELSQTGEFASEQTVKLVTAKGEFPSVRVLGPVRDYVQVEISKTDAIKLGLNPPVRMSGNLEGSEGAKLVGPSGEVDLTEGVILPHRHIHCPAAIAQEYGIQNNQEFRVAVEGERGLVFEHVKVKIGGDYELRMHVDTDEANAAGIEAGTLGRVII